MLLMVRFKFLLFYFRLIFLFCSFPEANKLTACNQKKTEEGNFAGQSGYGYISFEKFIHGINALKEGRATLADLDRRGLPTLKNTIATGAILEAGRRSIDEKRPVEIVEEGGRWSLH